MTTMKAALGAGLLALAIGAHAEPGVSRDTIKLGSYLPLQSGLAAGATQMKEGTEAYFKWVNDNGGVNGRKIEWIVENDSYNPQQTVAVVKKLVDRDDVFAVVSTLGTVTNLAVLPFLAPGACSFFRRRPYALPGCPFLDRRMSDRPRNPLPRVGVYRSF